LPEVDSPWVQEDQHHIQGQENEGVKVIAEIELNPGLADGLHATLEGGILDGIGSMGDNSEKPEDNGKDNQENGKKEGDDHKQAKISVVYQQRLSLQ